MALRTANADCQFRGVAHAARIPQLIQDAMAARFQIILAEALDRLSRNLADIAALYQRLTFSG
jgi:hypothetical protein